MASKYSRQPGDSILALLEPGEYVLNRNAVDAIGKENLDELNFEDAPRFNMAQRMGMQMGGMLGDMIGMQTGGSMEYGGATTEIPTFPYLYEKMDIQPVGEQKADFERTNAYDPSSEGVHFEDYSRAVSDCTKTGQQKLLSQGQELTQQSAQSGFAGAGGPAAVAGMGRDTIMDDFISQQAAAQSSLFKGVKSERDNWLRTAGQNLIQLQQEEGTVDYNTATENYVYNPATAPQGWGGGDSEPTDGTTFVEPATGDEYRYHAGYGWQNTGSTQGDG